MLDLVSFDCYFGAYESYVYMMIFRNRGIADLTCYKNGSHFQNVRHRLLSKSLKAKLSFGMRYGFLLIANLVLGIHVLCLYYDFKK